MSIITVNTVHRGEAGEFDNCSSCHIFPATNYIFSLQVCENCFEQMIAEFEKKFGVD